MVVLDEAAVVDNVVTVVDSSSQEGGAIALFGSARLEVRRSLLAQNRNVAVNGFARGGAISARDASTLFVEDSVFDSNFASNVGGVFFIVTEGQHFTVRRSTFSGNSAGIGGIADLNCNGVGTYRFESSTFHGNSSPDGAIAFVCGDETLELVHCSFAVNNGPLVALDASTASARWLGNAIDHSGVLCESGQGATGVSLGGNVTAVTDAVCAFGAAGDVVASPRLATSLAEHGGPTPTLAIDPTSPARGAAASATDQRGFLRDDGACDAGAFEQGATPP